MDLVSRLKEYILHLQMPVTQFADAANIPRPTFSQLLNGRNKKVSDELIGKIHAAFPELNILWLLFGENEMLEKKSNLSQLKTPDLLSYSTDRPDESAHNSPVNQTSDSRDKYILSSETIEFDDQLPSSKKIQDVHQESFESHEFDFDDLPSSSVKPESNRITEATETTSDTTGINFDNDSLQTQSTNNPTRKIVNIIVYYSDNSFESFTPDGSGKFITPHTNKI